jgi:hypothetical protein
VNGLPDPSASGTKIPLRRSNFDHVAAGQRQEVTNVQRLRQTQGHQNWCVTSRRLSEVEAESTIPDSDRNFLHDVGL